MSRGSNFSCLSKREIETRKLYQGTDLEASRMYVMTTRKSPDSRTWCEQKVAAYRAVAFKTLLSAFVVLYLHPKATIACHAMKKIYTKTFSNTAQIAGWTMIDIPEKQNQQNSLTCRSKLLYHYNVTNRFFIYHTPGEMETIVNKPYPHLMDWYDPLNSS